MLMTAYELKVDWSRPPVLNDEEEEVDQDPIKEGKKYISQLIYAIGDENLIDHFLDIVHGYRQQTYDCK